MRILLCELRKLLRLKYVLLALAVFFGVAFLYFSESNGFYLRQYTVSGDEKPQYSTGKSEGEYAETFRVYKWFTDNYGFTVDDDVITKTDALVFPAMEKRIAGSALFRRMGISSVAEYKAFLDEHAVIENTLGFNANSLRYTGDEGNYEQFSDDFFFSENEFTRLYSNWYIEQNELFRENGISSYSEMVIVSKTDDELYRVLREEYDKNIGPEIAKGEIVLPEEDELRWEAACFWLCYKVKRIYGLYQENPLGLLRIDDYLHWESSFSHTRSEYITNAMNNNTVTVDENGMEWYTAAPSPEYTERLLSRSSELGDSYFNIKPELLNDGYNRCGYFLFAAAACISLFLAGLYAVNDRKANVFAVIYPSKTGRKICSGQLLAVITSSVLINTVFVAVVLALSCGDLYSVYYNLPISSFVTGEMFWLDINMWQYIAISIAFSYVVTAAFSVAAYFICGFCMSYISAFAASVPLCAGTIALYLSTFRFLFSLPEWAGEDICLLAIILLIAVSCVLLHRRKTLTAIV